MSTGKKSCVDHLLRPGALVDASVLALLWPKDFANVKICVISQENMQSNIVLDCFESNVAVAECREVYLYLRGAHFTVLKPFGREVHQVRQNQQHVVL